MVTPGMRACAQARKMAQKHPHPTKNFFVLMQRGFEAEPIAVYSCILSVIGDMPVSLPFFFLVTIFWTLKGFNPSSTAILLPHRFSQLQLPASPNCALLYDLYFAALFRHGV